MYAPSASDCIVRLAVTVLLVIPSVPTVAQNSTSCLKPWAIPDRWTENQTPAWEIDDSFDRYVTQGPGAGQLIPNADVYVPPAEVGGTGFQLPADFGRLVRVKVGDPAQALAGGWFLAVDVNGAGGGGDAYRTAIATCSGSMVMIGDIVTPLNGSLHGPTVQGVADLIQQDAAAHWDESAGGGQGAIVDSLYSPVLLSPRIVPVLVFDPDYFQSTAATGTPQVRVVGILGIFVEGIQSRNVIGRIVARPQLNPS